MSQLLATTEGVLAWVDTAGLNPNIYGRKPTDHDIAEYLAECVRLRQAFEAEDEQMTRWGTTPRVFEKLRDAMKAKPVTLAGLTEPEWFLEPDEVDK